jgi:secondary thiamine-phosphate synthase enzyme
MESFTISSKSRNELLDITEEVQTIVRASGAKKGVVTVYVPHATAAVMINENADQQLPLDIIDALDRMVPEHGGYRHDRIDNNAAAHIKAAMVGPSESIPISGGQLTLGTWQNIFLCDFDGPRSRTVIVTVTQ